LSEGISQVVSQAVNIKLLNNFLKIL